MKNNIWCIKAPISTLLDYQNIYCTSERIWSNIANVSESVNTLDFWPEGRPEWQGRVLRATLWIRSHCSRMRAMMERTFGTWKCIVLPWSEIDWTFESIFGDWNLGFLPGGLPETRWTEDNASHHSSIRTQLSQMAFENQTICGQHAWWSK